MHEFVQVVSTTARRDEAERIARGLVEARLAACVQVSGPVRSVYRWKEAVEEGDEWIVAAKTRRDLFEPVEKAIRGLHPYEVPEILLLPILAGSRAYLEWLDEQLIPASRS